MEKNKRRLNQEEVIRQIFPMLINSKDPETDFVIWAQNNWEELETATRNTLLKLGVFPKNVVDESVSSSQGATETHRLSLRLPIKWVKKMDADRSRKIMGVSRNQWMTDMIRKYFE